MPRRAYDRTLRDAQARQTRERVLDAVIAALGRQEDLSPPALARAAGVSVPTVYRYFPTREALLAATEEAIGARLGRPSWPRSEEELASRVPERFQWFEDNADLIRAILASSLGRDLLRAVQRQREQSMGRSLSPRLAHLDPGRRRAVLAILSCVDHGHAWRQLRDDWGLSPQDATWASQWAVQTLLEKLAARPPSARADVVVKLPTRRSR